MAPSLYSIDFRHDINLLDMGWHGLFGAADVAVYAVELKRRFALEGFRPGYLLRIDMQGSAVQTQDAVTAFRALLQDFPRARRIAVVTPSAIARLQVRREMTQPYLQIFETAAAAFDWLVAPEMAPA